jgi:hypothetical protein
LASAPAFLPGQQGDRAERSTKWEMIPEILCSKADGFVKSPSAALRFNFVVAAHLVSALHSSVFARLASGAFYKTIVLVTFYEIITLKLFRYAFS